jgi:hypothetical protein
LIDENANLQRIGREIFSESFYLPRNVEIIGENCFSKCASLRQLRFESGDSLKTLMGDSTLDEVLDSLGLEAMLSFFEIEIADRGADVDFGGWSYVVEGGSRFALVHGVA